MTQNSPFPGVDAAALLGVGVVNTFVGRDWTRGVDENWPRFLETWRPIVRHAEERGIRIGNLADGKVLYRIPDPLEMKGTSAAEGVAVDARGIVYGGEVGPRQLARHSRQ